MVKARRYQRFGDYLLLILLSIGLVAGGIITMGCDPKITFPTGQLEAGQEGVRRMGRTGVEFSLDSTIEVARYELPSMVTYDSQEGIEVTGWKALSPDDSVSGATAMVRNTFTGQQPFRTAKFVGEITVPGTSMKKDVYFEIRVGWYIGE